MRKAIFSVAVTVAVWLVMVCRAISCKATRKVEAGYKPSMIAQSPILGTTLTVERLCKRGYEALFTYYQKVALCYNEPLVTRPVRLVV